MSITIPINRRRFPHVFIISCLFIGLIIYNAFSIKANLLFMNGLINWVFTVSIVTILLFYAIISLIDYFKTVFDKHASMIISDIGIVDSLSIFSCGKIFWNDVSGVEIKRTIFADFLIIKLEDPSKYLKGKNIIQQFVLKRYIKKFNSPVIISDQRVRYDLYDLKKIILEHKRF